MPKAVDMTIRNHCWGSVNVAAYWEALALDVEIPVVFVTSSHRKQ